MIIIAGCVIVRDNKLLMVQEAKEVCYGKWIFPAGKVEEGEKITDAAIRETFEETGCKVRLTGVLPIQQTSGSKGNLILIKFTADVIEENIETTDKSEILDVKWIDIDEVKSMNENTLRAYESSIKYIQDLEENNVYPIELFDDNIYDARE